MTRRVILAITVAALALFLGACGDDAATTTAFTTTTIAPTTTTAPTTTAPEETTLPDDLHPAWAIGWAGIWPPPEATAVYRVQLMGSEWMDLPAHFEYGVAWREGTWDRLVIGTVEPGEWGAALYFSRPEPWVLRLWGVAETSPDRDDVVLEYFDNPQDLDLGLLPETVPALEGDMIVEHGFGTFGPVPALFAAEWVGLEDVTVPAGTITGAYHLRFGLAGDFYGADPGSEITFFSDLWLHPEQLIVKWDMGPAGGPMELAEPWTSG
jgi:hypothetical protein